MEVTAEFLEAYNLVVEHEKKERALAKARLVVQAAKDAGVKYIKNPARVTHYNDKHFGDHSVSISLEHYRFIEDALPEEMKLAVQLNAHADGIAFPGKYHKVITDALEANKIAWKACYVKKKTW